MLFPKLPKVPSASTLPLPLPDQLAILHSLRASGFWIETLKSMAKFTGRNDVREALNSVIDVMTADNFSPEWGRDYVKALSGTGLFEDRCAIILHSCGESGLKEAISYLSTIMLSSGAAPLAKV